MSIEFEKDKIEHMKIEKDAKDSIIKLIKIAYKKMWSKGNVPSPNEFNNMIDEMQKR